MQEKILITHDILDNSETNEKLILELTNQAIELFNQRKFVDAYMLLVNPVSIAEAKIRLTFYDYITVVLPLSNTTDVSNLADEFAKRSKIPPKSGDPTKIELHIYMPSVVCIDKKNWIISVSDVERLKEQTKMVELGAYVFEEQSKKPTARFNLKTKIQQILVNLTKPANNKTIYVGLFNDKKIHDFLPHDLFCEFALVAIEEWLHILQEITDSYLSHQTKVGATLHDSEVDIANYLREKGCDLTPAFLNRYSGRK